VYFEQAFGTKAPLYYIDLNTGKWTRIPITSDSAGDREKDWLYSARLTKIHGTWYVGYSLNHLPHLSEQNPYQQRLATLDGKRGLNRLSLEQPPGKPAQPLYSHGGSQPAGRYECGYHGGGICLWDFDKWEGRMLVAGPQDGHISWEYLDDWFFAGTCGAPLSGPFSSVLMKVYADGTWYVVSYGNTRNVEYNSNFFANISPDGTKGCFSSTMLGPINMYWCVISYPDPPTDVAARTEGDKVSLSWKRPKKSAEIAGYNVYRGEQSGVGYERITRQIVQGETFTETVPDAGRAFYYVVTSVERSGLESRSCSGEAVGGRPDPNAPERLFIEAERGELKAPLRENLHGTASNLLFVDYRDGQGEGSAAYTFPTRKAGEHWLWVRCRYQASGTPAEGWTVSDGKAAVGKIVSGARAWEWLRLEKPVSAEAGGQKIVIRASGPGLAVDNLLLTDDPRYRPQGEEKLDARPPATPAGLKLGEARHFDTSLSWNPVEEDFNHYQVYRGTAPDFQAGQEALIGSPAVPRLVDWGLTQGTQYYYRVSAVDSFGNESAPSPALAVKTRALEKVVELAAEAEDGKASAPMDVAVEPKASGGRFVKMMAQGQGEKKAFPVLNMEFEVPVAGEYIVWLKLCRVSAELEYAYLSARVDGGPKNILLCYFTGRTPSLSYQDTCLWRYVYSLRQSLPTRFHLEPGRHRLTISEAYMQSFGLDQVIITNDLGRRPPG
jgi:fibronectin type 3 domain-containing protein